MVDLTKALEELQADLGYKRLNRIWAKLEILFGLGAASLGLLGIVFWVAPDRGLEQSWYLGLGGLLLLVLGGYLAMAGNRSHLYQSMNDRTAYLLEKLRRMKTEA